MDRTRLSSTSYLTIFLLQPTHHMARFSERNPQTPWQQCWSWIMQKSSHFSLALAGTSKCMHSSSWVSGLWVEDCFFKWSGFLFLSGRLFNREMFCDTIKCSQHCCRCCDPMNLLQILPPAFNALHFAKHRKSQLQRQRKHKERRYQLQTQCS